MEKKLDVSMLEPCEPLEQTLAAVQRLETGDYLRVIHRREPHMLYPLLEKGGFKWRCRETQPGRYEICIWKQDDSVARAAIDAERG
ncbi:MAG: DUF2249 domain-containing protein [Sedimenticola sp.]|nr:DUF2249 domain-containing protein [Sedimenticola sp.]